MLRLFLFLIKVCIAFVFSLVTFMGITILILQLIFKDIAIESGLVHDRIFGFSILIISTLLTPIALISIFSRSVTLKRRFIAFLLPCVFLPTILIIWRLFGFGISPKEDSNLLVLIFEISIIISFWVLNKLALPSRLEGPVAIKKFEKVMVYAIAIGTINLIFSGNVSFLEKIIIFLPTLIFGIFSVLLISRRGFYILAILWLISSIVSLAMIFTMILPGGALLTTGEEITLALSLGVQIYALTFLTKKEARDWLVNRKNMERGRHEIKFT